MKKRKIMGIIAAVLTAAAAFGIFASGAVQDKASDENEQSEKEDDGKMKMNVQVGDYTFTAVLEENAAVQELLEMMEEGPVTINMDDYAGMEKVGSLGKSLTAENSQTTTEAGDIVLYNGSNLVMFYGTNSWSYTRIGKIDDLTDWEEALGSGSITAVLSAEEQEETETGHEAESAGEKTK